MDRSCDISSCGGEILSRGQREDFAACKQEQQPLQEVQEKNQTFSHSRGQQSCGSRKQFSLSPSMNSDSISPTKMGAELFTGEVSDAIGTDGGDSSRGSSCKREKVVSSEKSDADCSLRVGVDASCCGQPASTNRRDATGHRRTVLPSSTVTCRLPHQSSEDTIISTSFHEQSGCESFIHPGFLPVRAPNRGP